MTSSSFWSQLRTRARQTVHNTFAGPVLYNGDDIGVTARWSNRLLVGGNGDLGGEYSAMLENADRLVFDRTQPGVTDMQRGATVTLVDYDRVFTLDTVLPDNGPVDRTWLVVPHVGG